jgi:hypothetical protein
MHGASLDQASNPSTNPTHGFPNDYAKSLYVLSRGNNDEVIRNADGSYIVSSQSAPADFHLVTSGGCTCEGWKFRHTCRHVVRVAADVLGLEDVPEPQPEEQELLAS